MQRHDGGLPPSSPSPPPWTCPSPPSTSPHTHRRLRLVLLHLERCHGGDKLALGLRRRRRQCLLQPRAAVGGERGQQVIRGSEPTAQQQTRTLYVRRRLQMMCPDTRGRSGEVRMASRC